MSINNIKIEKERTGFGSERKPIIFVLILLSLQCLYISVFKSWYKFKREVKIRFIN